MDKDIKKLANDTFALIDLVEISGIEKQKFLLIRKKLLDLGNNILRYGEKHE